MGPSITQGASMRSWRSAATKVRVFQWPCGTYAVRRWFRGPQPRKGSMLVFTQVSSMKTKRLGSTPAWRAFHRVRLRATSGRDRSEATSVFFIAQPLGVGENPNRARLRFHAALGQLRHKTAQGERRFPHACAQPLGDLARQRTPLVAADLSRRYVARAALQTSPLRNARRTDPKRIRNRADRLALLNPSQHPFTKIN